MECRAKVEVYSQCKAKISEVRRQKRHQKKQKDENDRKSFLKKLGNGSSEPLHHQSWVTKATNKFHKKMAQLQMEQCTECHERWYAPLTYKAQPGTRYLCKRCKKDFADLSRSRSKQLVQVTKFGKANDMHPGPFPSCARNLTQIEELLVSPIITCMPVYTIKGGSKRVSGNCINFVQHTNKIVNVLTRLPAELDTIIVHAAGYKVNNKSFKVNRNRVRAFCVHAKKKKLPGWDKVEISEERLAKLPEDDVPTDLPSMIDPNIAEDSIFNGPKYNEERSEDEEFENETDT